MSETKSVKLTVIDESIARCEKRIAELEKLITACPLTEIIKLRQEFAERLKVIQANKDYSNKEWLKWLKDSTKKEKELFKFAKTQTSYIPEWIDESVKLKMQLGDLQTEKFYAEIREKEKKSRENALKSIIEILDKGNVEEQFKDRRSDYHSSEKFIVTWNGNWNGMPSEFAIELNDKLYESMSGTKCIYATRGLLHEKQLGAFRSIERGLIVVGLKLCPTRKEKKKFFDKYAVSFNERIKQKSNN